MRQRVIGDPVEEISAILKGSKPRQSSTDHPEKSVKKREEQRLGGAGVGMNNSTDGEGFRESETGR